MPEPLSLTGDCFWCGEVFDTTANTVCPTCAHPVRRDQPH